jgi:hypothetical protein
MISISQQCSSLENRSFGRLVGCDTFNSTQMFEQNIFTIGASVLFLLIIPLRVRRLLGEDPKTLATGVYRWKIVSISAKTSIVAYSQSSGICSHRFCAPNCLAYIVCQISFTELFNRSHSSECCCCVWPSHAGYSGAYTNGAPIDFDHHLPYLDHYN